MSHDKYPGFEDQQKIDNNMTEEEFNNHPGGG